MNAPLNPRPLLGARETVDGDPSFSLTNLNTARLPNATLVWVIANSQLYYLDKESTATPNGSSVVEPSAGPGRWIAQDTAAAIGGIFLGAAGVIGADGLAGAALVATLALEGGSAQFTLNGAGQLVYTGTKAIRVKVSALFSALLGAPGTVSFSIEVGGAPVNIPVSVDILAGLTQAKVEAVVVVSPGDTIDVAVAGVGAGLTVTNYTLNAVSAGLA